jgi:antirestriction protein ArdC
VAFDRREYWAATIVHELGHSTGHPKRMNRNLSAKFGSDAYACEEARAEMAAVFVCNTLNLPADFAKKKLREDKREILHAAADTEKIAAYVLAWHPAFAGNPSRQPGTPPEVPDCASTPI